MMKSDDQLRGVDKVIGGTGDRGSTSTWGWGAEVLLALCSGEQVVLGTESGAPACRASAQTPTLFSNLV